jgi:methanogenic corrinoid protein MtbC1
LVEALISLEEDKAERLLSEAYALHTVEAVMLELMQASMTEIGHLWHEGKVSTATEHFASSYVQGRLRSLLNTATQIRNVPAALMACAPGEQHELGALVLAVLLRRAGYRLYFLGANTPLADLRKMARRVQAIGVMISASSSEAAQRLMAEREWLAGMAPVLAFGGLIFNEHPELAKALGGVYLAASANQAVEQFHNLVQAQGAIQA